MRRGLAVQHVAVRSAAEELDDASGAGADDRVAVVHYGNLAAADGAAEVQGGGDAEVGAGVEGAAVLELGFKVGERGGGGGGEGELDGGEGRGVEGLEGVRGGDGGAD